MAIKSGCFRSSQAGLTKTTGSVPASSRDQRRSDVYCISDTSPVATETSAQLVGLAPRGGSETICSTRTAVEPAGLSQRLPSTVHYKTRLHK